MKNLGAAFVLTGLFALTSGSGESQEPARPVKVKFHEPRVEIAEAVLPVDPTVYVQYQSTGAMGLGLTVENKMLCCGAGAIRTSFKIDNQMFYPANAPGGVPLKPLPSGKKRQGMQCTWQQQNIHFTQTVEIVPSRNVSTALPGQKRRQDTVLIGYTIENRDTKPRSLGARVRIDTYCVDNDGALFASPTTHPGQILNGMELKDKTLPEFVQILQRPDLKNPGFVGHFTLKMGSKVEGPNRFIMTAHGAGEDGWNITILKANGDTDCGIFWDPKVIPPGGKRELAYGYGQGIASSPENEGKVTISLGGSFEPTKTFTVQAFVEDPLPNQTLNLELPAGMELVEGKEIQPVPPPPPGMGTSLVLWKGRVQRTGDFALRVRSSNGVLQTRTVSISRE